MATPTSRARSPSRAAKAVSRSWRSIMAHRLFSRDLSLCWHDTALLSNTAQKVTATILELFDRLGKRREWTAAD